MCRFILIVIILAFYAVPNLGAKGVLVTVEKIGPDFQFDGKIEINEWSHIDPLKMVTHVPNFGDEPSEKSEIRLAYDSDHLYLSGVLWDNEASKIMANSKKRDALTGSTDWFGMVVDSYNDKQTALAFFTTPTGLRLDASVQNDARSFSDVNTSWNNFWDVRTYRDDKGWYAEIRIPFTSIPYQQVDDKVIMGVTVWRYIARKYEVDIYPPIPPDYGDASSWKPSLAQEMKFENLTSKKPFYLIPYALAGYSDSNELNDDETAYINDRNSVKELGVDIKYGISNNWTLDLSYNTDFAQVEVDDQQVNLTRFSLFFPEKRLFFQERAGIFDFKYGRNDNIFYSRRIGIDEDDDGKVVSIYGGMRLVGKKGPWDIGLLSMQTESSDQLNSENFSVARIKRKIINENSDAGLILTNRMDFDGNYNTVYGLDASVRVKGDDYFGIKWAQSFDSEVENNKLISWDNARFQINFVKRSDRKFSYGFSFAHSGATFYPKAGFNQREDFNSIWSRLRYSWYLGESSKIFKHGFYYSGNTFWKESTGNLESLNWRGGWSLQTKNGWAVDLRINPFIENLDEEFELTDDVDVPIGEYNFMNYSLEFGTPYSYGIFFFGNINIGNFYDGTKKSFAISPNISTSASLEINGTYEFNKIDFEERQQKLNAHIGRLKFLYMFSTKLSLSSFIQYNSSIKSYLGNIKLRYNPKEGIDLYIVINGDLNTDRMRETPFIPRGYERSILVKYSYTFNL